MLRIRRRDEQSCAALQASEGEIVQGLREDTDYVIELVAPFGTRLYIDDVEIRGDLSLGCAWRPSFYAGTVRVEAIEPGGVRRIYRLDVSPNSSKAGDAHFADMIRDIRAFDASLLLGETAATIAFDRGVLESCFDDAVMLARMRQHGPAFFAAMADVFRSPHLALARHTAMLPISRTRRIGPELARDPRVVGIVRGTVSESDGAELLCYPTQMPNQSYDTPANRAMKGLLQRMRGRLVHLGRAVDVQRTSGSEAQIQRLDRRQSDLKSLDAQLAIVAKTPLFRGLSRSETSAAALTQISSNPVYGRAYRLGSQALSVGIGGSDSGDDLHVSPSWGVYEVWCFLSIVRQVRECLGIPLLRCTPHAASAQLAFTGLLPEGGSLEVLFQAVFLSIVNGRGTSPARSLSRERRPDILLVMTDQDGKKRALVLDAKWRSGTDNILDAMESAHIYHDSLRIDGVAPPSYLLLPGDCAVEAITRQEFIQIHGVGAFAEYRIDSAGLENVLGHVKRWLQLGC